MSEKFWSQEFTEKYLLKNKDFNNIALNSLTNAFQFISANLFLYEPDESFGVSLSISEKSIAIDNASPNKEIFEQLKKGKAYVKQNNSISFPIKAKNTRMFGYFCINDSKTDFNKNIDEVQQLVLNKLSNALYEAAVRRAEKFSPDAVVRVKDLVVEYSTGLHKTVAVDKISFDICEKEFTVILGASGCGKTSLLNSVGCMLTPKSGEIIYNGENITKYNNKKATQYRCDTVGFIFQQYNLIPDLTAKENVEVASALVKDSFKSKEVLDMVGLSKKQKNYPGQMSGGEQQRVCIARALVKKPSLLLCDEPTGALDTTNAIAVMKILQSLVKENDVPVVMITHNEEFVSLAQHYILMSNGKIVEEHRNPFSINAKDLDIR